MYLAPEKNVYLRLITSHEVARIVGFQVYAIAVPKGASIPFIVFKRAGIVRESALAGPLFMPVVSLQVSCWGLTHDAARELSDAVRLTLDGHIGEAAGVRIDDMRLISEVDDFIDPSEVLFKQKTAYEVRQIYSIRWQEATG